MCVCWLIFVICMYIFRCMLLSVYCVACCATSGVKPSGTVPVKVGKTVSHFHSPLFLNSFSCAPQQGSLLHFTSYKIHPHPLFCCVPALIRKLFPADMGVNLARNGEKCISLVATFQEQPSYFMPSFSFFFSPCPLTQSLLI